MRFTLTIMDTGHALLSTRELLKPEEAQQLQDVWRRWREQNPGLLVVGDCEVRMLSGSIELEVDMAEKSDQDLVDKQGNMDLSIDKGDVDKASRDAGLEPAGEAQDHPTMDAPDAPRSITGDATPEKRG